MFTKIEKFAKDLQAEYGSLTKRAVKRMRKVTMSAADLIHRSRRPVRKFADRGIKLNRISHKSVEKLVRQQANVVESVIEGGAKNLKLAARADSLRDLFADQIATLPKAREWAGKNARQTIDIVLDTGDEIGGVFRIEPAQPKAARKVARKTTATRKRATKTVRKTTAKARKTATARTASAKKATTKAVRKTRTAAKTNVRKIAEAAPRVAA